MRAKDKRERKKRMIILAGLLITALVLAGLFFKTVSGQKPVARKKMQTVQLVKTQPPPPKPEQKLPEPKPVQEEVKVATPTEQPAPSNQPDAPPPGANLGVDAEGGAGSDGFGLVGNKGGASLVGGSGGTGAGNPFGWYAHLIEDQISRELVRKAKLPKGEFRAKVRIELDGQGRVVSSAVYGSSGNREIDQALAEVLGRIGSVSTAPPAGMPRVVRLLITTPQ